MLDSESSYLNNFLKIIVKGVHGKKSYTVWKGILSFTISVTITPLDWLCFSFITYLVHLWKYSTYAVRWTISCLRFIYVTSVEAEVFKKHVQCLVDFVKQL